MLGGALYCYIIGAICLVCAVFAGLMITALFIGDWWSKRRDPGAPGFLEMRRPKQNPPGPPGPQQTDDRT